MPVQDSITEKLTTKFRKAIGKVQGDDRVEWDVAMCFLPQAPPFYAMLISIPSPILGNPPLTVGGVMQNPYMTQDDVDGIVRQALENLRTERTKELHSPQPVLNDPNEGVGENGLITATRS